MSIIAPTFHALIQALRNQGFSYLQFRRSPFKQGGLWVCEVQL